jgi:hypothetical protein
VSGGRTLVGLGAEPDVGLVGAVADGHTEVEEPGAAQRAEDLVVERGRGAEVAQLMPT